MNLNHSLRSLWFAIIATSLILPATVWGLANDTEQPIYIEADSATMDDEKQTAIYRGNAVANQGSIQLKGHTITIIEKNEGENKTIITKGNPCKFKQELENKRGEFVRGFAKVCHYDSDSELMYLIGKAKLTQEGDTFQSDRIVYDRSRSLVKGGAAAKGKQRIRIKIRSNKEKKNKP